MARTDRDVPLDDRQRRATTAAMAADITRREPNAPSLIPSADGAITRMLMTIPSYAVQDPSGAGTNPYAAAYRDMLAKLPASIELLVLTHEAVEQDVTAWLDAAGRADRARVVATDDFLGFSVWAEDGYVVVTEDRAQAAFIEPAAFGRYGDALVADRVSEAGGLGLFQAPLHLQGGNVLIGDNFFFIGLDYPILTFEEGILDAPSGEEFDVLLQVYRRYLDTKREFIPVASRLPVPPAQQREFKLDGQTWVESLYAGNATGTRQPARAHETPDPGAPEPGCRSPRQTTRERLEVMVVHRPLKRCGEIGQGVGVVVGHRRDVSWLTWPVAPARSTAARRERLAASVRLGTGT